MNFDPPKRSLWSDSDGAEQRSQFEPLALEDSEAATSVRAPRPAARSKGRALLSLLIVVAVAGLLAGAVVLSQRITDRPRTTAISLPVATGTTPASRTGQIYRQVQHGVVEIRTTGASGTGFIVDGNGIIVTNAHVVSGAKNVRVIFDDGKTSATGTVLGSDVSADLAAIRIDPASAPEKLTVLGLADSDQVRTGDQVIAIGYPLGLDLTATDGIVSGLGRQIKAQNGFSIDKVIQTDASINPGNSGGPLLDANGRVIGVNSQIATTAAGSNTGIGFAIPANEVRTVIPQLVAGKAIARPYLGVSLSQTQDNSGAIVGAVAAGGPGEKAGLRGAGDKIVAINGAPITTPEGLIAALDSKAAGDTIELGVRRNGQVKQVTVTLGTRPGRASTSSAP